MSGRDVSHDKVFKTVFRYFLKDLVELVHPELAATLDLDHPKFLDKDLFVDFRKAGHREPDLVAEASTWEGEPRLVLVHLDVEGNFRREAIDHRMPRYSMHLALTSDKPVISVAVFLHGGQAGAEVRKVAQRVGPFEIWRFRYLAFGLSKALAEEYVGRPQPLAAALAALMRSEIWDRVEKKVRCLEAVIQAEGLDLARRYMLAKVVDAYIELDDEEKRRFAVAMEEHKEVLEMVVTWEEALAEREAKGRDEGEARGRVEGHMEGRVAEAQEAIWLLMKHRFRLGRSELAQLRVKLQAISDLDRLHEILERASEAERFEEVDMR